MAKVIIAFDDTDVILGDYFSACKNDISGFFYDIKDTFETKSIEIKGRNCNQVYIELEIEKDHPNPFIFVAYTHGNENSLKCNGSTFIATGLNTGKFNKSLFYTSSCLSGVELGPELIKNGCYAFIGYTEEVELFLDEEYQNVYINCDNSGLKTFLSDNITISGAFERMINYYSQCIDKYSFINPLFAAQLVKNREALVLHKTKDIVKEDLLGA